MERKKNWTKYARFRRVSYESKCARITIKWSTSGRVKSPVSAAISCICWMKTSQLLFWPNMMVVVVVGRSQEEQDTRFRAEVKGLLSIV